MSVDTQGQRHHEDATMDELYAFTYGVLVGIATKTDNKGLLAYIYSLKPDTREDQQALRELAQTVTEQGWGAVIDAFYAHRNGRLDALVK